MNRVPPAMDNLYTKF